MSPYGTFEICRPSVTVSASGEENRKSSTEDQTDAIDPKATLAETKLGAIGPFPGRVWG